MIVVFVVDTSPSMGDPQEGSMTKLDIAKMAVESITKNLEKRMIQKSVLMGCTTSSNFSGNDQFLLLSTGRQYSSAFAACGAGGRLLVGYSDYKTNSTNNYNNNNNNGTHSNDSSSSDNNNTNNNNANNNLSPELQQQQQQQQQASMMMMYQNHSGFERELKSLKATSKKFKKFPEDGGGAHGLNLALSVGLQLLSRYRLEHRTTENFGMGRLPSTSMLSSGGNILATHALQPAALVLLTDGQCLRATEGGGPLKLQFGKMTPLREFYREPFRWDQRMFCIHIGEEGHQLHPSLKAFCEVTGGCPISLVRNNDVSHISNTLVQILSPPTPRPIPIPNPLPQQQQPQIHRSDPGNFGVFVNGGPLCCFQPLEGENTTILYRAMLLYVPHNTATNTNLSDNNSINNASVSMTYNPPIWCIPESYFPSKKLDTLPPRLAQPVLHYYSKNYQYHSVSNVFDPMTVIRALTRLDQLMTANRQLQQQHHQQQVVLLQRDTYICEWTSQDGKRAHSPYNNHDGEYYSVCVRGAGRVSLSGEGEENMLNIGILHIPSNHHTLSFPNNPNNTINNNIAMQQPNAQNLATITFLPPDPHILLPLLVRAAELEHRALKKLKETSSTPSSVRNVVHLDDHWRSEFRAYLFRIPPYYQSAMRRSLRPILPVNLHSLLSNDGIEEIAAQCYSRQCLQKIRSGEQYAKENNERLERIEEELKRRSMPTDNAININNTTSNNNALTQESLGTSSNKTNNNVAVDGYGQFDTRSSVSSYLAALRNMPPPWRVHPATTNSNNLLKRKASIGAKDDAKEKKKARNENDSKEVFVTDCLGDLPSECLLAYYESRRRWIFGKSGLTTRGLSVEGVNNDGSNCHKFHKDVNDESLLVLSNVGAATVNQTSIAKMGDYKERLLWSRQPMVGYGSNDSTGSAITTAADGSPIWSVDDDAFPLNFFHPQTGEFLDSVQNRVKARIMINFGNPFRDKRGDTLVPEKFQSQRPRLNNINNHDDNGGGPMTPPGSPPHEEYSSSVEGEGEAVFTGSRPPSPQHVHNKPNNTDDNGEQKTNNNSSENPEKGDSKQPITSSTNEKLNKNNGKIGVTSPSQTKAMKSQPQPPRPPPKQEYPKHMNSSNNKKPPPPPPPRRAPSHQIPSQKNPRPSKQQPLKPPPPKPPKKVLSKSQLSEEIKPSSQKKQQPPPPKPPPKPTSDETIVPKRQQQQQQQQPTPPTPAVDLQNPNMKPAINLPPGWMCVWSKSQKRWYFFDTKTNQSVWEWPPPSGLPR